eukprot:Pompholyxophrys_sp_v1_NODE_151_length_1509_cov_1.889959.p2 type:complete len:109 gc:universal NODE_151_length_1509_cov_1.889959:1136-810(-)
MFPRTEPTFILVISPLRALMKSQVDQLKALQISAIYFGHENHTIELIEKVRDGHFIFIFAAPESTVHSDLWAYIFRSPRWQYSLKALVFDEAHVMVNYRGGFRPLYKN